MSKNINGVPVIFEEEDSICDLCGKLEECRPYGSNGESICYDCAMKDKETTNKMMSRVLFGDKEPN